MTLTESYPKYEIILLYLEISSNRHLLAEQFSPFFAVYNIFIKINFHTAFANYMLFFGISAKRHKSQPTYKKDNQFIAKRNSLFSESVNGLNP